MKHDTFTCTDCQKPTPYLYTRIADEKEVCFDCLDPVEVDKYPQWREKEMERRRRSEQAKRNFGATLHQSGVVAG